MKYTIIAFLVMCIAICNAQQSTTDNKKLSLLSGQSNNEKLTGEPLKTGKAREVKITPVPNANQPQKSEVIKRDKGASEQPNVLPLTR